MRTKRAQVPESLDEVGLSLPIATDKEVGPGDQVQLGGLVIAEVRKTQVRDSPISSCARGSILVNGVPTELVAERSHGLHRRGLVTLARNESRKNRRADRRDRNGIVERLLDGPPSPARVVDGPLYP